MIGTLDHNCLIELEQDGPQAKAVRFLVRAHAYGQATIRVVAVGASERIVGGGTAQNYSHFEERLQRLGLGRLPVLLPLVVYDYGFWAHGLLADDEMGALRTRLRAELFPKKTALSRGDECDVLSMWAHIYHEGDTFITSDGNFHRKAAGLARLGAGVILSPNDAVATLSS